MLNTETLTKSALSPLRQKAVLVSVSCSQWTGFKKDKRITRRIHKQHGASDDAGSYNKRLISKHYLAEIDEIVSQARQLHRRMTRPWADQGLRILPNVLYVEFADAFRKLQRKFDAAADKFSANYASAIAQRKIELNGMFNESDYPSPDTIRSKFELAQVMVEFPDAEDFRADLDQDILDDIKAEMRKTNERVIDNAMKETYSEILEKVSHMATKLGEYKGADAKAKKARKGKGRKGRNFFYDSMVDNLRELADLLPAFNLTDDPKLNEIAKRIKDELCIADAPALREDTALRKTVQKSADNIVKSMTGLFA